MNILQCKICNKPFQSQGGKICFNCLDQMEKDFIKVRDYIYENEYATMEEVCEETEVQKNVIMHFLKEGRLTMGGGSDGAAGGALVCEVCKKPINTGKMCNSCKGKLAAKMQKTLESTLPPPEPKKEKSKYSVKDSAKMHIQHDR